MPNLLRSIYAGAMVAMLISIAANRPSETVTRDCHLCSDYYYSAVKAAANSIVWFGAVGNFLLMEVEEADQAIAKKRKRDENSELK